MAAYRDAYCVVAFQNYFARLRILSWQRIIFACLLLICLLLPHSCHQVRLFRSAPPPPTAALWFSTTKNPGASAGPFACQFACSLTPFTHFRARGKGNDLMSRNPAVLTHRLWHSAPRRSRPCYARHSRSVISAPKPAVMGTPRKSRNRYYFFFLYISFLLFRVLVSSERSLLERWCCCSELVFPSISMYLVTNHCALHSRYSSIFFHYFYINVTYCK